MYFISSKQPKKKYSRKNIIYSEMERVKFTIIMVRETIPDGYEYNNES